MTATLAKFEPPVGKTLFVVGQDCNASGKTIYGAGYGDNATLGAVAPAGVSSYYSLTTAPGAGLTSEIDWGTGPLHADAYLNNSYWNNSVICLGLYMQDGNNTVLSDVVSGGRDEELDALITWLQKVAPRPVFLRIGYEFDYQYAGNPQGYVDAWKYVVDLIRSKGLNNVAFVWQAASGIGEWDTLSQWYPGDEYVDWLGFSYFEYDGTLTEGSGIIAAAKTLQKPVMIAESTPRGAHLNVSAEANTAWTGFFSRMFTLIESNSDVVKALCYINQDWDAQSYWYDQGWGNSRIQDTEVESKWNSKITEENWLHASPDLFSLLAH